MSEAHDEAIAQALETLQRVEPPAGMEARILRRLNAPEPVRRSGFIWWHAGGLAAVAAVLLAVAVREHRAPRAAGALQVAVSKAPAPGHGSLAPLDADPAVLQPYRQRIAAIPATTPKKSPAPYRPSDVRAHARATPEPVVSYPAPAEPLTEQEKLLQRVARQGNQEDFALLNPESVELALARDKADFDDFLRTSHKK